MIKYELCFKLGGACERSEVSPLLTPFFALPMGTAASPRPRHPMINFYDSEIVDMNSGIFFLL